MSLGVRLFSDFSEVFVLIGYDAAKSVIVYGRFETAL